MKRVYCDRCSAEMKPDTVGNMTLTYRTHPEKPRDLDLCPVCSQQFVVFFYSTPRPAKVEPKETDFLTDEAKGEDSK